mmetsp:Transcript_9704/g.10449  ORF Transcript_9704/g.10449 Transcript_9704/m.10449 type:complete len:167 (+) Transcript_9704:186-686(+)
MMAFTSTTTRLVSRRCANNGILGVTSTSIISPTRRCLLSTHCQEAVGRFKGALEEYRINNYQQEMPTRFKKEIIKGCSLLTIRTGTTTTSTMTEEDPTNNVAVQEIEQLLRNIGAFGDRVTHDDVELIVSEHSTPTNTNTNTTTTSSYNTEGPTTIHADQILMQLL